MWHAERGSRNDGGRAAAVAPFLVIELGEKNIILRVIYKLAFVFLFLSLFHFYD